MTIKLIATDLDGTLFGADHKPSARSVAAVNAARAAGIRVVAVTGRSHFTGAPLAISTGAKLEWFIGTNGGHRLNYRTGELEERITFRPNETAGLLTGLRSGLGRVGFGCEIADRIVWDERFLELSPIGLGGERRQGFVHDVAALDQVGKLFVAHPKLVRTDLVEEAQPHVGPGHNVTTSGAAFIEITPAGADKGAALARLCALLDIKSSEVIAFGDNQNDLTMLSWAGRGVAMENALPMVQAVADEIAPRHTHDGVAQMIEALLDDLR